MKCIVCMKIADSFPHKRRMKMLDPDSKNPRKIPMTKKFANSSFTLVCQGIRNVKIAAET